MRCVNDDRSLESSQSAADHAEARVARPRRPRSAIACRMCGRSDVEPVGSVDACRYLHCRHCDFTFLADVPDTQEVALTALCGMSNQPSEVDTSFLRPALDQLRHRPALRVLDYGGRDSITPDLLRQAGHRVITFDLAPGWRQHPDRIRGDILQRHIPEAQFDLVYAYRVFEHLHDPAPVLRELLRLARPGGLVLIHTDLERSAAATGLARTATAEATHWWYNLPPDICAMYRLRTFEQFVRNTPHRIIHHDAGSVVIQRDAAHEQ